MFEARLSSPKQGDKDRRLFEKKYSEGDHVMTSQIRVDTTLRRVHKLARIDEVDLIQLEALLEAHLAEAIARTSYENSSNIMDYFHLRIKHAMIHQIVHVQRLFKDRAKFTERRELVDGAYGAIAAVLEEAIELYDSAEINDEDEHGYLTGAINELTVLALLNRRQVPERIAIPSDIISDLFNATDLEYFVFRKGNATSNTYHIQVKTGHYLPDNKVKKPFGGILIHAEDVLNHPINGVSFPTSRAIVADVNAVDTTVQARHLENAMLNLDRYMHASMDKSDELFNKIDALDSATKTKLDRAISAVHTLINTALETHPEATTIIINVNDSD